MLDTLAALELSIAGLSHRLWEQEDQLRRARVKSALETDAGLTAWVKDNYINGLVVRASLYGNDICSSQEFLEFRGNRDPRRPVIMRGSLNRLLYKHSQSYSRCANGWCYAIMERWVRRIRYMAFSHSDFIQTILPAEHHLFKKHGLSYHFSNRMYYEYCPSDDRVWINGTAHYDLTRTQMACLKKIHAVIGRIDKAHIDRTRIVA